MADTNITSDNPADDPKEAAIFDPITNFPFAPSGDDEDPPRPPPTWMESCGALFALMDFERSLGSFPDRNLAEIYLRQYVRHPAFVMPQLFDLHTHHAAKLRRRRGMAQLETMILRVSSMIDVRTLPSMTTPIQATQIHVAYATTLEFLQNRYRQYAAKRDGAREQPAEIKDFEEGSEDEEPEAAE